LKISKNTSAAEGHFGGFESDRRTLSSATAVKDPLWKKTSSRIKGHPWLYNSALFSKVWRPIFDHFGRIEIRENPGSRTTSEKKSGLTARFRILPPAELKAIPGSIIGRCLPKSGVRISTTLGGLKAAKCPVLKTAVWKNDTVLTGGGHSMEHFTPPSSSLKK